VPEGVRQCIRCFRFVATNGADLHTWHSNLRSDWIAISIGSLDHPEAALPNMHWGIESQVSWLSMDDGLPRRQIEGDPEYMAMRQTD
jgi:hypothetical protein